MKSKTYYKNSNTINLQNILLVFADHLCYFCAWKLFACCQHVYDLLITFYFLPSCLSCSGLFALPDCHAVLKENVCFLMVDLSKLHVEPTCQVLCHLFSTLCILLPVTLTQTSKWKIATWASHNQQLLSHDKKSLSLANLLFSFHLFTLDLCYLMLDR